MTDPLVPEDFDLEKAMNARSSTPPEKRKRCPNCGCADIHTKVDKPTGCRENECPYFCSICRTHFEDPIQGESELTIDQEAIADD